MGAWIETVALVPVAVQAPVAPRVGAWIETTSKPVSSESTSRRPSRGGVDRNHRAQVFILLNGKSPLAWGRGSKLLLWRHRVPEFGRPSRGGVDRNSWVLGCLLLTIMSPLAWGRGSKQYPWSENYKPSESPLAWGRGSKLGQSGTSGIVTGVAPRVGAWIETFTQPISRRVGRVAPRVGAWIETIRVPVVVPFGWSPLAWGRGSKPVPRALRGCDCLSPLAWGRGSKLLLMLKLNLRRGSPLAWGRGSKPFHGLLDNKHFASPLAWGRGSKHPNRVYLGARCRRPSRGGVDRNLDNRRTTRASVNRLSPLAWGRGSKLIRQVMPLQLLSIRRRPSRGGVDRNTHARHMSTGGMRGRRPSRGGVDRNFFVARLVALGECRPSRGGVDRNTNAL